MAARSGSGYETRAAGRQPLLILLSPEVPFRSVTMSIYIYIYIYIYVSVYVNNMADIKAVLNSRL